MATPTSGVNRWLTLRWATNNPGTSTPPGMPIRFDEQSENVALQVVEYGYYVIEVTREARGALTIWIDGKRLETRVAKFIYLLYAIAIFFSPSLSDLV